MQAFPKASPYRASNGGGSGVTRTGVPRPEGRCIRDDQGLLNPLGLTFMWSMQGIQWEWEHYKANIEWARDKRFDFVRPLTEVDWAGNRLLDPQNQPWWPEVLRRLLDVTYENRMRCGVTLRGKGTGVDHMWLAREVARAIADGRTHKVLACEMENEYSNGGDPLEELMDMAREMAAIIPNMLALSTPGDANEAARIHAECQRLGLEIMILHTERNTSDHGWRDVRQAYDFNNFRPLVGADWEGPGPASSVSVNASPLQLAMKRFLAAMCGAPIFVLHTGTGVFGDGQGHPTAGPRPANFWEIDNIDNIVSAIRNIDPLIPEGVSNWTVANTQWEHPNPVAPFQPHHHWEGDHENDDKGRRNNGVNKAYSALAPDGRVVQAPMGVREHALMTASYPLREVTVFDPLSLQPVPGFENRSFNTGETMDLPGGEWNDPMVAYIIHGRR